MSGEDPLDLFDGLTDGDGGDEEVTSGSDPEGESSIRGPREDASDEEPPASPDVWEVSEINAAVRTLLEDTLPLVWIRGEVANWTRARSGHCYFTLKDDRAQIRCVMWRTQASRLPADPEEGMRVRIFGRLTLYEARGEYQIGVRELQGEGEDGLWKLAFEKLRRQLAAEGLLDPERRRAIPRFPGTVGVVTSPTGAALRDIVSVIRRRAPWTRVLVRGARVQGEGASLEVARALRELVGTGQVDVVIVGRGGGSIEDLWAFNEEPVARAIADSPVPVISAVGHETDVTISDLVADLRAPTPSAAAESAVQDAGALAEALGSVRVRLARGLRGQLLRREQQLREFSPRIFRAVRGVVEPRRVVLDGRAARLAPAMRRTLAPRRVELAHGRDRLQRATRRLLAERRERLFGVAGQVEALSPLATLRRGYAIPLADGDRVLRRRGDFAPDGHFELRVVDGRIQCRVEGVDAIDPPAPEPKPTVNQETRSK